MPQPFTRFVLSSSSHSHKCTRRWRPMSSNMIWESQWLTSFSSLVLLCTLTLIVQLLSISLLFFICNFVNTYQDSSWAVCITYSVCHQLDHILYWPFLSCYFEVWSVRGFNIWCGSLFLIRNVEQSPIAKDANIQNGWIILVGNELAL